MCQNSICGLQAYWVDHLRHFLSTDGPQNLIRKSVHASADCGWHPRRTTLIWLKSRPGMTATWQHPIALPHPLLGYWASLEPHIKHSPLTQVCASQTCKLIRSATNRMFGRRAQACPRALVNQQRRQEWALQCEHEWALSFLSKKRKPASAHVWKFFWLREGNSH